MQRTQTKEVSEVLNNLKLNIVIGQECWERKGSVMQGYKWLGKPHKIQKSQSGSEVLDS